MLNIQRWVYSNITVFMSTYWDTICLFNVEHKILNKGYFIEGKNNLYPWKRMKEKKNNVI